MFKTLVKFYKTYTIVGQYTKYKYYNWFFTTFVLLFILFLVINILLLF